MEAIIAVLAFIVSAVSLGITWKKNVKDKNYGCDKELFENLKNSLESAYAAITVDEAKSPTPSDQRIDWLTAARHIQRYRELRQNFETRLFQVLMDEQEEYWRNKFYILLKTIKSGSFFQSIDSEMEEECIDVRSAAVVYSFAQWKKGFGDPMENVELEEMIKEYGLFSSANMAFKHYIATKFPGLAKKISG
ncbi:hypothetical protein [uncultured Desulfosarcina sp.]|uniref:hypothetical protein n=1 Tax=uncultured Desulfosarcina sp. TaxID=218289 RepID=UPI0029C6A0B2|nr:hypothetical protein [uncultured Desulfosarcina sp.]